MKGSFGITITINDIDELLEKSKGLKALLLQEKLILIRGLAPLSKEDLVAFGKGVNSNSPEAPFVSWDFGDVMELKEDSNTSNYLFTREEVPFHWDGAFHIVPSILLFHCIKTSHSGGQTLYANTEALHHSLSNKERELLKDLEIEYVTEKKAHYGGTVRQKVLGTHPATGKPVLTFAEKVHTRYNPVSRNILSSNSDTLTLLLKLDRLLYSSEFCTKHRWSAGDIILADNHALLHARESFNKGSRHIRRIQLR